MMQFITGILNGAPIWVWPLLVLLIVVGLRARQARRVPVAVIYALPLLGVMPLRSAAALDAGLWIWVVFAGGYLMGAMGGFRAQGRWIIGREGAQVHVAGESLTLTVMMIVFWANFAQGFVQAIAPQAVQSPVFQVLFVGIIAASAGSFGGRALRVLRSPQSTQAAPAC